MQSTASPFRQCHGRKEFHGLFLSLLLLLFLLSCHSPKNNPIPAFYHWQTTLAPTLQEYQTLASLKTKKLYTKFFDIDLDDKNQPIPLASLQCPEQIIDTIQIVPTIFITNRTLVALSDNEIKELSQRVLQKINTLWPSVSKNKIKEIQFDCDWTPGTQRKYFDFLNYFRKELHLQNQEDCTLSATIRLHQIKYADQTGVPPVDRGMLMFYNMGDVENMETPNSILDLSIAKQYLHKNTRYPLPLDMALPIFRWGVLFRNGKMIKLINNLDAADLQDTTRFVSLAKNQYEVVESTYLKGYYLYGKDVIRLEWVSPEALREAAGFLNEIFYNNTLTVSLYQLDTSTLKHYSDDLLQTVFQEFSD